MMQKEPTLNYQDEGIAVLIELGLTPRQAQVYLANAQAGQATAKALAKRLQTDRAEVYRAIIKLEKLGLVQRNLSNPVTFKAIEVTDAFYILLHRNAEKLTQLQTEAERFAKTFKEQTEEKNQDEPLYKVIQRHMYNIRGLQEALRNCRINIDLFSTLAHLNLRLPALQETFEDAMQRGVRIRYLTYVPSGEKIPAVCRILSKNTLFELRYTSTPPPLSGIGLEDKKRVSFITKQNLNEDKFTYLSSDDPSLVAMAQDYFELKWAASNSNP